MLECGHSGDVVKIQYINIQFVFTTSIYSYQYLNEYLPYKFMDVWNTPVTNEACGPPVFIVFATMNKNSQCFF